MKKGRRAALARCLNSLSSRGGFAFCGDGRARANPPAPFFKGGNSNGNSSNNSYHDATSRNRLDPRHVRAFVDVSHMLQRKNPPRATAVSVTRNGAIAVTGSRIRGQSAPARRNTPYRD
ncbi:hypothetical protein [Lysobacter gummosus]|uniref:hypothetical protein n=1 Tax=Lysobacter gummosus TaxID=262324 RepID=UPI00362DC6C2